MLQELIKRGILAPNLVMSWAHQEKEIDQTVAVFREAMHVYTRALNEGVDKFLLGKAVKPVYRKQN